MQNKSYISQTCNPPPNPPSVLCDVALLDVRYPGLGREGHLVCGLSQPELTKEGKNCITINMCSSQEERDYHKYYYKNSWGKSLYNKRYQQCNMFYVGLKIILILQNNKICSSQILYKRIYIYVHVHSMCVSSIKDYWKILCVI